MTLFKEDLHNVVAQIFARVDNTYCQIVKEMAVDTVFIRFRTSITVETALTST